MTFDLARHEILVERVVRNARPARLYEDAVANEGAAIADSGVVDHSLGGKDRPQPEGQADRRSPRQQRQVWWGPVNIQLDEHVFLINRQRAIDYLNTRERLYVIDGFAGWDPRYRLKVRVICSRPYHALFMHNMLIRPTAAGAGRPSASPTT